MGTPEEIMVPSVRREAGHRDLADQRPEDGQLEDEGVPAARWPLPLADASLEGDDDGRGDRR